MAKITIDVPDEIEMKARMLKVELSLLLAQILKEKIREFEEIERVEKIVSKSQATEQDVEELTNEVNTAMWEYYKKKYKI